MKSIIGEIWVTKISDYTWIVKVSRYFPKSKRILGKEYRVTNKNTVDLILSNANKIKFNSVFPVASIVFVRHINENTY